jgi:hypothetical protein
MGSGEIKIPVELDTAKAVDGVKRFRAETDKATEAGESLGSRTTDSLKRVGGEAVSLIGTFTGIGLSIGGIVSAVRQVLEVQKEINAAQSAAIKNEQERARTLAQQRVGPDAQRAVSELGLSLQQQADAARKWAIATGQAPEAWRGAALETGRANLGEMEAVGKLASATGIPVADIPDMLELGMGARTPEARRVAMGQVAALSKNQRIEGAGQVAQVMQNFGERIRAVHGLDPLAVLSALSKRYSGRKILGIAQQLANGEWPEEMAAVGLTEDIRQNKAIMEAGTFADVEAGAAAYMKDPDVRRATAAIAPSSVGGGARGVAVRVGDIGDELIQRGGEAAQEEIYRLERDGFSPEDAREIVKARMTISHIRRQSRRAAASGNGDAMGVVSSSDMFLEDIRERLSSGHAARSYRSFWGDETKPSEQASRARRTAVMLGSVAEEKGVNIGVFYGTTPKSLGGNDSTRLGE